ncbi:MAG: hypothetical protein V1696_03170 [Candidatus Jorgensenbacteria bacterium]
MRDRTKSILEGAVKEFIRTGEPITSEHLFDAFEFGIKPAMIRWELKELSRAGYFSQRHPSGGRFPTNRAYRFYVQSLLGAGVPSMRGSLERALHGFLGEGPRELVGEMADYLGMFSAVYEPRADHVYESGLEDLMAELDLENRRELMEVIRDIELLPERIMEQGTWRGEREWPQVFVGGNPFTASRHLSVVAGRVRGGEKPLLLLAVGPTRMDYEKSLRLFRALCDSVS